MNVTYQFIVVLMFVHVQIRLILHHGISCRSFNGSLGSGCGSLIADVPADPALVPGLVVAVVEGEQPVEQLVRSGKIEDKEKDDSMPMSSLYVLNK